MSLRRILLLSFLLFALISFRGDSRDISGAVKKFQEQEGTDWSIHRTHTGNVRSLYGRGHGRPVRTRDDAKSFVAEYAEMFGIQDLSQLHLEKIQTEADKGASYHFGQYVYGIPVAGSEVSIHTDRNGFLIAAASSYKPLHALKGGSLAIKSLAHETATRIRYARAGIAGAELMVLSTSRKPRYVWKFVTHPTMETGQYAIYVDALSPERILLVQREFLEAEATGTVFRENPIVTPNQTSERFLNLKNANTLDGKFVKTYNANFSLAFSRLIPFDQYTTAAETDQDYTYPADDAKFTEAMAYYHINAVHDSWRALGFKKLNRQVPVFVNVVTASGMGFDNAFYTRGQGDLKNGVIVMGSGRVFNNFGHDGDVYYHEYGHAILDFAKPRLFETFEHNYPFAFHEGFADISSSAITGNSTLAEYALRNRETGRFAGRELDNTNRFPENVVLRGFGKSESHYTGLIVGGAWWDLQETIGLKDAHRLLYKSLPLLPNDLTFFDVRDALLAADRRANGNHEAAIQDAFARHGIQGDDPGQPGSITFQSLKTAKLNESTFRLGLKSRFKRGDTIIVLANYVGKGLTPGYNLLPVLEISGPANANISAFPFLDEVVNGKRTRKRGAWVTEIQTFDSSALGSYTVTIQLQLGGSSLTTDTKSVTFHIVE